MLVSLLQVTRTAQPRGRVALEPVYNTLNSMALLSAADLLPALDGWVQQTSATLSPAERHTNRLIFEGMGAALLLDASQADFGAYLDALTAQHPQALRDQVLAQVQNGQPGEPESAALAPTQLLANPGAYVEQVRRAAAGSPIDEQLHTEVHALLNDPFRMHDLIITHLRGLWETALAAEWARMQRQLENQVRLLQTSIPGSGHPPEVIMERLQSYIAGPAGVAGAQEIVFVPSAHTGRHTTQLWRGQTCWLFFDAVPSYPVLLRESSVGDLELIGRISALSEPMRLRVLGLLAQHDELTPQQIMEALGLSQPNVSRYLKALNVYVSERRARDGKKHYRVAPAQLELTFQALRQTVLAPRVAAVAAEPEQQTIREGVGRWCDTRGVVTAWPGRDRDRQLVLEYVADRFTPGQQYSEKEVNELITQYVRPHARDHVTIRRDLVDFQFLSRASDGSRYWRNTERQA